MARDDLTCKLRLDTSGLFNVGKCNDIEHQRLQWRTKYNLDLWFMMWKHALIDQGFGRERTEKNVDVIGVRNCLL